MPSALGGEISKVAVTLGEIEDRAIWLPSLWGKLRTEQFGRDGGMAGYYKGTATKRE